MAMDACKMAEAHAALTWAHRSGPEGLAPARGYEEDYSAPLPKLLPPESPRRHSQCSAGAADRVSASHVPIPKKQDCT